MKNKLKEFYGDAYEYLKDLFEDDGFIWWVFLEGYEIDKNLLEGKMVGTSYMVRPKNIENGRNSSI